MKTNETFIDEKLASTFVAAEKKRKLKIKKHTGIKVYFYFTSSFHFFLENYFFNNFTVLILNEKKEIFIFENHRIFCFLIKLPQCNETFPPQLFCEASGKIQTANFHQFLNLYAEFYNFNFANYC